MPTDPLIPPPDKVLGSSSIPPPGDVLKNDRAYYEATGQAPKSTPAKKSADEIIDDIPDLDDGKKQILKGLAKARISQEDMSQAIGTLQGKHPKQEGGSKFYLNDKGYPVPLKNSERPPEGYKISSVWGSDQEDDNLLTTFTKNMYNFIPSVIENVSDMVHLPYALGQTLSTDVGRKEFMTGMPLIPEKYKGEDQKVEEADWYKGIKSAAQRWTMPTSTASKEQFLNTEGIDEFKDIFDGERWKFTPDNVVGTTSNLVKSIAEFVAGGEIAKPLSVGGKLGATQKALTASYMTQLGEVLEGAKQAGLSNDDAYKFASTITLALSIPDAFMGVEGRIFKDQLAKADRTALIKGLTDEILKDSDGKITADVLEKAFKETTISAAAQAKKWAAEKGADAAGEAGQESLQSFIQKAGEQIYDTMSDEEKKKFGTDAFSPESFGNYLQDGIAGALGGAAGGIAYSGTKKIDQDNNKSKTAFDLVKKGDDAANAYKFNIQNEVRQGKLTQDQADAAIARINTYKEYNDILGSTELEDEKKREVFDKTFQKQSLETELENMGDPKKLHPLKQAEYSVKQKIADDLQKDINNILLDAEVKKSATVGEKTVNDIQKKEDKETAETEKPKPGETKKPVNPALQAFKDKYREKGKWAKVDERTYEEIPASEYNDSSFNNRLKHAKTAEYLDRQPEKTAFGTVAERHFSHEGKTNSVLGIELEGGKKLRFASSMLREEGFRGHFRQEQFEQEFPVGLPIGIKVEEIPALDADSKPKKVIKAFNAKTGKFIGWMKETTAGTADYSPEQKEVLSEMEMKIEPPMDLFNEAVAPVEPKTPTKPESVKSEPKEKKSSILVTKSVTNETGKFSVPTSNIGTGSAEIEVSKDVYDKWKEVDDKQKSETKRLDSIGLNPQEKSSRKRETALKYAAEKRKILGTLTEKERKAEEKNGREEKNTPNGKKPASGNVDKVSGESQNIGNKKTITLRRGTPKARRKIKNAAYKMALRVDPVNPYDVVLQYFIQGGEINSESLKKFFKGDKTEISLRLNYNRKKGPTLDQIAHDLWEENPGTDVTDFKNAVEQVILNFNHPSQMAEDINRRYNKVEPQDFSAPEKEVDAFLEQIDNKRVLIDVENVVDAAEEEGDKEIVDLAEGPQKQVDDWIELKDIIRDDGSPPVFEPKAEYLSEPDKITNFEVSENTKKYKTETGEEISFNSLANEPSYSGGPDLFSQENQNPLPDNVEDVCWMERQMNKMPYISFTGGSKIKSTADVAYLFRHLESESSENVFAVFHKQDGSYNVLYISTGTTYGSTVDTKLVYAAAKEFGASKVTFVHNHPSGNLKPSDADYKIHKILSDIFAPAGIEMNESVIINLDSGKYAQFNSQNSTTQERPTSAENEKPVEVFRFDKQILYTPSSEKTKITSSQEVAEFLSKQKRGLVPKTGMMVLDRANTINRYVMIPEGLSSSELMDLILTNVGKSGESVILSTNAKMDPAIIVDINKKLKDTGVSILDVIQTDPSKSIKESYKSMADSGVMEPGVNEDQSGYKKLNKKDFNYFRDKYLGRDSEEETEDLANMKDLLDDPDLTEEEKTEVKQARDGILDAIREDKDAYFEYLKEKKNAERIQQAEDFEGFSLDDLVAAYNFEREAGNNTTDAKLRLGNYINHIGTERLREIVPDIDNKANTKNLTFLERWNKVLSNISEYFPSLQELYKVYDQRYLEKVQEMNKIKATNEKLAKAVIKEKNGKLGSASDWFTSNSAKYFEYLDDGGKLRTNKDGLSKAQIAYLDFFTDLVKDRKEVLDDDGFAIDNTLIKIDKGFQETFKSKEYKEAFSLLLPKSQSESLNWKGQLTSRFDRPYEGKSYSKDFYKAANAFIEETTHVKYMNDLVPVVDAIELFYKNVSQEKRIDLDNLIEFIQEWKKSKLYQESGKSDPKIDIPLRTLRGLTSVTTMAWNIPANAMNVFIGNANAIVKDGVENFLVGNKRLTTKKGREIVKMYDVIKTDYDSNPKLHAKKVIEYIAFSGLRFGEMQIQGSQFLGKLTDKEYNSFEMVDGELRVKSNDKKELDAQMRKYKREVSDVQGKYSEQDKSAASNYEFGKALLQFKQWLPAFWKDKFGAEFINSDNEIKRGTFNYNKNALNELKADWSNYGYFKGTWKNEQTMSNIKYLAIIASLTALAWADDDDDKKRKQALSVDNALHQMMFVFDLQQSKYMVTSPIAAMGPLTKLLDAMIAITEGDSKKFKKNAVKLIPHNKALAIPDQVKELTK